MYNGVEIPIYEFKDAHGLIFGLAERYKEDYTVITRGRAKERKKVGYYHFPCSFDIETTTVVPGQLGYEADPDAAPVAFPYLFQFNIYGSVIFCRTYEEALQVFDWTAEAVRTDEYSH